MPPLLKQSIAGMQSTVLPLTIAVVLPGQALLQAVKIGAMGWPTQFAGPPLTMQLRAAAVSCRAS